MNTGNRSGNGVALTEEGQHELPTITIRTLYCPIPQPLSDPQLLERKSSIPAADAKRAGEANHAAGEARRRCSMRPTQHAADAARRRRSTPPT